MYSKAAAGGDRRAMKNLGSLYEMGRGVQRDYAESLRWYKMAAELGDWSAMVSIGKLYERGLGVAKSTTDAREWYQKAADAENAEKKILKAAH
jgi:TPR repeat protein